MFRINPRGSESASQVALHTFPLAETVLLPSGSSEKSVSEEKRVSVSLQKRRERASNLFTPEAIANVVHTGVKGCHLLREGEV